MRFLTSARETCEKFHPDLMKALEAISLTEREAAGSQVVEIFRSHGGAGLLVPAEFGGHGADPLEAVRIQRALGSLSPSLGVATVMHHFTVAMLFSLARTADRLTAEQRKLLASIASDGLLLSSAWAEGRTSQNILLPAVVAERVGDGYRVNGEKKPCSLSRSMDLLTASVSITDDEGRRSLALLLIPADSPGISVEPFWSTPALAAAQSDLVRLTDVMVPQELVISSTPDDQQRLDDLQTAGFTWFELLVTSAYTGVAATLVTRVLEGHRGSESDRAALGVRLQAAIDLQEGAARAVAAGVDGDEAVALVLVARYATQDLLAAAVDAATELLGGMAFVGSPDVAYLASAVRALAFHPPSRGSLATELVEYFEGSKLRLS